MEIVPGYDVRVQTKVIGAYFEDGADVRILDVAPCGCAQLTYGDSVEFRRRDDRVFLVVENEEYLLYDYSAEAGETIQVINSLYNGVEYTNILISEVLEVQYDDTTLTVIRTDYGTEGYLYIDLIVDLVPVSFLYPEWLNCDPACGGIVSYTDTLGRTICFDPKYCTEDDQDFPFSPFAPDLTYFFKSEEDGRILAIDDTYGYGPQASINRYPSKAYVNDPEGCLTDNLAGWAYSKINITPDTLVEFYNVRNEEIEIYLNRNEGDRWLAYESATDSVYAYVEEFEYREVENIMDTIMCIGFDHVQETDGPLSDKRLCIAKHGGVQELFSFLHFPHYDFDDTYFPYEFLQQYDYEGRQERWVNYALASSLNLNWTGVTDFEIGDILHVEEGNREANDDGQLYQDKLTYIGDGTVDGGQSYNWLRERLEVKINNGDSSFSYVTDTFRLVLLWEEIFRGSLEPLPGTSIVDTETPSVGFISFGTYFNDRVAKAMYHGEIENSGQDSCWYDIVTELIYNMHPTWIRGLGGPYYDIVAGPVVSRSWRLLKYYNKVGEEEWGTPFSFTVSTREAVDHGHVKLYPNPANGTLHVDAIDDLTCDWIEILDVHGNVVFATQNVIGAINISMVPQGAYLFRIKAGARIFTGKLVVVR